MTTVRSIGAVPRCSEQSPESLVQFFRALRDSGTEDSRAIGDGMLAILSGLASHQLPGPVWGLTSHSILYFLAHDDPRTPWFVSIVGATDQVFVVDYLIPAAEAPWLNARARGEASSVERALELLDLAFARSKGWQPSATPARCCEDMELAVAGRCGEHLDRFQCPDALLHRSRDGGYGLIIHDGGRSTIGISFCPWCGARLEARLPDE